MEQFEFNNAKFRELVKYIALQCESDPRFGAVKLNKILYFADFNAYRILGSPITGASYQKLTEGPAPREMLSMRRIMIDAGDIEIEHRQYFTGIQQRVKALKAPDTSLFTREELQIVDEAVIELWSLSARQASDYSHLELGWSAAKAGEVIPYETAWLDTDPISQAAEEYWRSQGEARKENVV